MGKTFYTSERAQQILIQLLKEHDIHRIIASPGTTNLTFVASLQVDSFFTVYSSVDERSAAYMACGMAAETGEPVVITCTGATASRNYMPGMTEAYYSKLPVLAVTANSGIQNRGHLIAQQLDRSRIPVDVANLSIDIPVVKDDTDAWLCNVNVNRALLELRRNGGGPVHINLSTTYSNDFTCKELPKQRVIRRLYSYDEFPELQNRKTAIFLGRHHDFDAEETKAIENFCSCYNAVVFGDHSSGYYGRYFMSYSAVLMQSAHEDTRYFDVMIHLGEVSGDYPSMGLQPKEVWRVSPDGEVKDPFHKLTYIFEMSCMEFFTKISKGLSTVPTTYYEECIKAYNEVENLIPELPFGNIWIARYLSTKIPAGSEVHLGILNTLRSWNLFQTSNNVRFRCNVGGFGIDGVMSTTIGASLINPDRIFFCFIGDLAFFYDLNSIANRHVGSNLRIMLINNGRGTEFNNYGHLGHMFGKDADPYIAAAGHFGNKSQSLIRHFAQDLGFQYIEAKNKEEFIDAAPSFLSTEPMDSPIVFEVFTDSTDESDALEIMHKLKTAPPSKNMRIKSAIRNIVGDSTIDFVKKFIR